MTTGTSHGYLIIADISGYTSYLSKVDLEHAEGILSDLMEVIVEHFRQVLSICKLEGDAVFANLDDLAMPGSEALLELIEETYLAFRRRRDTSQRLTTCSCRVCQLIPSLDLKFFVHHGEYILQDISGNRELVGSDVNLVHRLTKNKIAVNTGWHAYTLFTKTAFELMNLELEGLHEQIEAYEYLGTVASLSMDVHPRYEVMVATRRVVIAPEQADYKMEFDFEAPAHIVWEWLTNVDRRSQASGGHAHWSAVTRPKGRRGVGAQNHCAHGKGTTDKTMVDWLPFESYTNQNELAKIEFQEMYLFTPLEDGQRTQVEVRLRLFKPKPLWLSRIIIKILFVKVNHYLLWFKNARKIMNSAGNQPLQMAQITQ